MFTNIKILLGITGGIAAYKSAELIRKLKKKGAIVKVVMTKSACEFITPLTIQTLSKNRVHLDMFQTETFDIEHISLARWADIILIAPTTANFIAKMRAGIADDLLSTIVLAATMPIILAPAMNQGMWKNKITQTNIKDLQNCNINFFMPASGLQACGETGAGRMQEPEEISINLENFIAKNLLKKNHISNNNIFSNRNIIITAGPTQESIDCIRFLTNKSSGKMGYALAQAAKNLGANVTLISGPTNLTTIDNIEIISVNSAHEMLTAVLNTINNCDIFIGAAAVANYTIQNININKIKSEQENLTIALKKTEDIIATVANLAKPPYTVGFAAESENLITNAKEKLRKKKLNMIIGNLINIADEGFNSDYNSVTIITPSQEIKLEKNSKKNIAEKIMQIIFEEYTKCTSIAISN